MLPLLFQWGEWALPSYSVFLGLGFCAFLATLKIQEKIKGDLVRVQFENWVSLGFAGLLVSLFGARILYFLVEKVRVKAQGISFWHFWEGGLVFYGGLVTGLLFLWIFLPRFKIPRQQGFEFLAPALALGHALGRVGCYLNGCCYGSFCKLPWAVTYTSPLTVAERNVPLHPVQLYEATFLFLLGSGLLFWNFAKFSSPPNRFLPRSTSLYFVLYGLFRFFIEFLRADPERGFWGPFSTSQWISIFVGTLGCGIYAFQLFFSFDLPAQGDFNARHESPSRKP